MMDGWKITIGAMAFGAVIGWLLHTFVRSSDEPSFKLFSGLSTILAGAGAIAMLRGADGFADGFMLYFVGMAISVVSLWAVGMEPEEETPPPTVFARQLGDITAFQARSPAL